MTFSLTVKTAAEIAADELAAERAGMRVFRRAFNLALADMAATGNLTAIYPSETTMLGLVDAFAVGDAAALATALSLTEAQVKSIQRARLDITEYLRMHADVATFQAVFGLTDTQVDDLFRAAMALDA